MKYSQNRELILLNSVGKNFVHAITERSVRIKFEENQWKIATFRIQIHIK